MTFYRDKYRVETTRLQNWNYASEGSYFITICTKNREHFFGNIESGEMKLNDHGCIVQKCWFELAGHYQNLQLDTFMVMPNHIHGIMTIDNSPVETGLKPVSLATVPPYLTETGLKPVSTVATVPPYLTETGFKPVSTVTTAANHGIFEFVRAFKTFSSRQMNEMDNTPGKTRWQTRFHDHIIRDEQEFHRIEQYILNNPSAWENDSLKS